MFSGPATSSIATAQRPSAILFRRKRSATLEVAPDRRSLLRIPLEDLACAALFAFFSMQGSIPGIAPGAALEITGSAPTALTTTGGIASQIIANGLMLLLLLRHPRLLFRRATEVPSLALFALLTVASTAWSLDPVLTLRRSLPFALAGLFGLWFAARFSPPRQLAILRLALTGVALATIAVVVLVPSIGLDHTPGHAADWQGVFTQKNACGRIMVLASATVLFAGRLTPGRRLSVALFVFVLIMSGSRGAWTIEAAIFLLWLVLAWGRHVSARARMVFAIATPMVCAALLAGGAVFAPTLMRLLGRDFTFSGRTAIWAQVLHFIWLRPLLGYGYAAFWPGMSGPSLQIDAAVHFVVVHAHNGFLEIALELGLCGLALFLAGWIHGWLRLWPLWCRGQIDRIAWPVAVLVLILLYDLDESTLLIYNGLFWVLYVAALAQTNRSELFQAPNGACPEQVAAGGEPNG